MQGKCPVPVVKHGKLYKRLLNIAWRAYSDQRIAVLGHHCFALPQSIKKHAAPDGIYGQESSLAVKKFEH